MKNKSKNKTYRKTDIDMESKNQIHLNQLLKPALFLLISIILELIGFLVLKFKTSSGATQILPTYPFFDIGYWLFICALLICCAKNWIANIIFYISLLIEALLLAINITIKSDFGYLFTIDMYELISEAFESIDLSFINFKLILIFGLTIAFVIALPLIFDKLFKKFKIKLKKVSKPIFCLLIFLFTFILGTSAFTIQSVAIENKQSSAYTEISDDKYLFDNMQIKDSAYKKFGSCGFYLKNLYDFLFKDKSISKKDKTKLLNNFNSSMSQQNLSAPLKNDNLIVIMLESFEWFAIDPYNTPNLWALKTGELGSSSVDMQATVMTNYVSNNKTNVSEDLCLLGYMPNVNITSLTSKNNYSAKYSIPNLFKNDGYSTTFIHSWKKEFYKRNTTNINIGFDKAYFLEDFNKSGKSTRFNYYNLEADFINQFIDKLAPTDKKFMSFYTTVSSHGSYKVVNKQFNEYYQEYDANLSNFKTWLINQNYNYPASKEYQSILKQYKCAAIDTDKMIGILFDYLKDNNLINNTDLVIYADHNAYFHKLTNKIKDTKISDYDNQYSYTVPLMIYSHKLAPGQVTTFCSPYDLYPTIANLFGFSYNTICAQGKDIFSSDIAKTVYMSYLTGFYSPTCYSKDMDYCIKYEGSDNTDLTNFKLRVCEVLEKQKILEKIYSLKLTY